MGSYNIKISWNYSDKWPFKIITMKLRVIILADTHGWNLIPFHSLNSRISVVNTNIADYYIFLDPISRSKWQPIWGMGLLGFSLWQGKKPRIRMNILQWGKEICTSQLTLLLYWCHWEYQAERKELECSPTGHSISQLEELKKQTWLVKTVQMVSFCSKIPYIMHSNDYVCAAQRQLERFLCLQSSDS